jgi:hypothetical protein
MRSIISLACLSLIALSTGCTSATDGWPLAKYQSVAWNVDRGIPRAVRAPTGHVLLGHLTGRGTATFTLQADPRDPNRLIWVMTDDHGGELFDDEGHVVAHRDATHWSGENGLRLTTEPLASVARPGHVPWMLSKTTGGSESGGSVLGSAQFVQQTHTIGGPRRLAGQEAGAQAQADYTADYYFYGAMAPQTRIERGADYSL